MEWLQCVLPYLTAVVVCGISITLLKKIFSKSRFDVAGKVCLITGASSGLGKAIAQELYLMGARVVLSSRRKAELDAVKEELLQLPTKKILLEPVVLQLDICDLSKSRIFVDELQERVGKIDVLICNAGISVRGEAMNTSLEVDQKVMNVNYFGQVALIKAALPLMLSQPQAVIVGVSSLQGRLAVAERAAYSASKHAFQGFLDSLRTELSDSSVHVCVVSPSYIRTNLSLNALSGDGSIYGEMDRNTAKGMDPVECAKKIISAVETGQNEVIIAPIHYRLMIGIRSLLPALYFKIMRMRYVKEKKSK